MLSSVLDAKITNKLVRLGSRSSDERIAEYTLDKLEKVAGRSQLDRSIGRQYAIMKEKEEEMVRVMKSIQEPSLSWSGINTYLEIHHEAHGVAMSNPPFWIRELAERHWSEEAQNGEWATAKGSKKQKTKQVEDAVSGTFYGFWRSGSDLAYITPRSAGNKSKGKSTGTPAVDPAAKVFFAELGFDSLPPLPTTTRAVAALQKDAAVWSMSLTERQRLAEAWENEIRSIAYESNLDSYKALREGYKEACKDWNDARDEVSLSCINSYLSQLDLSRVDSPPPPQSGRYHRVYHYR
jgi:hypothetical protein